VVPVGLFSNSAVGIRKLSASWILEKEQQHYFMAWHTEIFGIERSCWVYFAEFVVVKVKDKLRASGLEP
jgi:hypothetical protein